MAYQECTVVLLVPRIFLIYRSQGLWCVRSFGTQNRYREDATVGVIQPGVGKQTFAKACNWPIPAVQTQSGKWHVNSLGDHVRPADCPRHTRTPDHFDRNQQPGDKQHATTKARQETARQPRHQPGRSKSPHKPFHHQSNPPVHPCKKQSKKCELLTQLI